MATSSGFPRRSGSLPAPAAAVSTTVAPPPGEFPVLDVVEESDESELPSWSPSPGVSFPPPRLLPPFTAAALASVAAAIGLAVPNAETLLALSRSQPPPPLGPANCCSCCFFRFLRCFLRFFVFLLELDWLPVVGNDTPVAISAGGATMGDGTVDAFGAVSSSDELSTSRTLIEGVFFRARSGRGVNVPPAFNVDCAQVVFFVAEMDVS